MPDAIAPADPATEDFEASEPRVRSEASAPFAPPSHARGLLVCPRHWPAITNGFGRVKGPPRYAGVGECMPIA